MADLQTIEQIEVDGKKYEIRETNISAYEQKTTKNKNNDGKDGNWRISYFGPPDYPNKYVKLNYREDKTSGTFSWYKSGNLEFYYLVGANEINSVNFPDNIKLKKDTVFISMNVCEKQTKNQLVDGLFINVKEDSSYNSNNNGYLEKTPSAKICSFSGRTTSVNYFLSIEIFGEVYNGQ